jgi:AcrR family transcriptional regulator
MQRPTLPSGRECRARHRGFAVVDVFMGIAVDIKYILMSTLINMNAKRTYTMTARARSAEETRQRILGAAMDLQTRRLASEIGLDAVAAEAGVSVQTILRHFGTRADLFDAAVVFANAQVAEERRAASGDIPAAMAILVDHYEKRGDMALMMLAQETTYDHVRQLSDAGKDMHRHWVAEVFAPHLARLTGGARDELLDLLVVATDVYTWKLLRRDRGHSRAQTEQRMNTLVSAVLAATAHRKDI